MRLFVEVLDKSEDLRVVAEGADQRRPVLAQRLGPRLRHMISHEGEIRGLLPLRLRIQHPGEAELRVKPAEEAVEGGSVWFVRPRGVSRGGRVDRDGGVTGGRLARHPRGVGVRVRPRPRLEAVGKRPGGRVCDDLDSH